MNKNSKSAVPVYFADSRSRSAKENKCSKIEKLFKKAGFASLINKDDLTAIKVHFGERGNDSHISPIFSRIIVDMLKKAGANPFITDTNTLYKGSRHNAVSHLETALEHGYGYATVGAPLLIADGLRGGSFSEIPVDLKHFKSVKIAMGIVEAKSMIVLSHFKGHAHGGFGGAIKNLAMGCAPSQGKCEQHASRFEVEPSKCISCGMCLAYCPQDAISWKSSDKKKTASVDKNICIGCGECLTVCKPQAIGIDWETESGPFNERMAEYAYGVVQQKKDRIGFINFLLNITPDCDCASWSDAPMVPDIGILASTDPVALDKACYDLVNAQQGFESSFLSKNHAPGEDKFKGAWSYTTGEVQFLHAESIGMGSTNYKLINV